MRRFERAETLSECRGSEGELLSIELRGRPERFWGAIWSLSLISGPLSLFFLVLKFQKFREPLYAELVRGELLLSAVVFGLHLLLWYLYSQATLRKIFHFEEGVYEERFEIFGRERQSFALSLSEVRQVQLQPISYTSNNVRQVHYRGVFEVAGRGDYEVFRTRLPDFGRELAQNLAKQIGCGFSEASLA